MVMCWGICGERNRRTFNSAIKSSLSILTKVNAYIDFWTDQSKRRRGEEADSGASAAADKGTANLNMYLLMWIFLLLLLSPLVLVLCYLFHNLEMNLGRTHSDSILLSH